MKIRAVSSENRISTLAAYLSLVTLVMALTGCGLLGERVSPVDSQQENYRAISSNLLNAVLQQSEKPMSSSTVKVTAPDSDFEYQVYAQMTHRGYVLETVAEEPDEDTVDAMVQVENDSASELARLYVVTVGDISAERRYTLQGDHVAPASEMIIRGAENGVAALNDKEVFGAVDDSLTAVVFETKDPVTIDAILQPAAVESDSDVPTERKLEQLVRRNIFDTQESNFGDVFVDYDDVQRITLVFPDDSMRLGETNKEIIQQYKSMMNPQTDVLSVIGCSLGPTEINNGNAVLALGRASRVKEALMFSGVQPDKVLDEGCWAPQDAAENLMPDRGVVLTLKRAKSY